MKKIMVALCAVAALVLTGCSSVSTGPDEVALHYKGGSFSSKSFEECVGSSSRQFDGPGDGHFSYYASQRNLAFPSKDDGTDSITFVTKDGIEMSVSGIANFLLNTDCSEVEVDGKTYKGGALQVFHELIGRRYEAYIEKEDDGRNPGWNKVLSLYVFRPLDTAIDRAAQEFTYQELYFEPAAKTAWEKRVLELLPDLVNRQTDGEVEFFQEFAITLQKPEPPQAIKDALISRQTEIAKSDSEKAKAAAAAAAAQAELAVTEAQAKKKAAEIRGYGGIENYLKALCIENGCNPYQPTYVVGGVAPK